MAKQRSTKKKTQVKLGSFPDRIKRAREFRGLTQHALAAAIGLKLKQQHIERMENRPDGWRSYYTAQIATVCGVNPKWLATGEGEMVLPTNLPEEALALGAAWFFIKGGAKESLAHDVLSTALAFLPTKHPLYKTADRLYREISKKARITSELNEGK